MHESIRTLGTIEPMRDPVFIAAFTGFTDQQGGAAATIEHLIKQWKAEPIAEIDPEGFYDFTVQRPRVRLDESQERVIDWPVNRFFRASPEGVDRDFLLFSGVEPHLRWRTFTEVMTEVLEAVGSTMSLTLGAQPAQVPHTRPLATQLSASHEEFEEIFSLKAPESRYQGQTGIVGVLNLHLRSKDWRNASLWSMSPHYLTVGPNPNIALALTRLIDHGFSTTTPLDDLEEAARAFEEQVQTILDESSDAAAYVSQLEEQYDSDRPSLPTIPEDGTQLPTADELLGDLEEFLRDQRSAD